MHARGIAIALVLCGGIALSAFLFWPRDRSYVAIESDRECIEIKESPPKLVEDFLSKFPNCPARKSGVFHGADYTYIGCGDHHIVTSVQVIFSRREACHAYVSLAMDAREKALGVQH